MDRLLAIVGPTAAGKSRLAFHLAQVYGGEIIGADSRQVYRYMDIGTAKPAPEELALVPHHLVSIVDPDEEFSLARYQSLAYRAIDDIHGRGRLPMLVGGTGLYIWAVLEGWQVPRVPPDPELRRRLETVAAEQGADTLFRQLARLDPAAAQTIEPRNVQRVIRALEVIHKTEAAFSGQRRRKQVPPYRVLIAGLTADREVLYARSDQRVDEMVKAGLVNEVQSLVARGYRLELPAMSGIGYRQIGLYLKGETTLAQAVEKIKFENHRYIRQQYAWFRLKDDRIKWFDIGRDATPEIEYMLSSWS